MQTDWFAAEWAESRIFAWESSPSTCQTPAFTESYVCGDGTFEIILRFYHASVMQKRPLLTLFESLTHRSISLDLSLSALNSGCFIPKKDYEQEWCEIL